MGVVVLITKHSLGCCHHFTVWGTSFHSDNFYITTLHICSQETAFLVFLWAKCCLSCTHLTEVPNNHTLLLTSLYQACPARGVSNSLVYRTCLFTWFQLYTSKDPLTWNTFMVEIGMSIFTKSR